MKSHCVIGVNCGRAASQNKRTWFDDQEGAVRHAEGLARKAYQQYGRPCQLLVVKVEKVIEIGVPPVVTRDLTPTDIIPDMGDDD